MIRESHAWKLTVIFDQQENLRMPNPNQDMPHERLERLLRSTSKYASPTPDIFWESMVNLNAVSMLKWVGKLLFQIVSFFQFQIVSIFETNV